MEKVLYLCAIARRSYISQMGGCLVASKKISQITRRETFVVAAMYLLFFVWWYATAYGFGDDPSQYEYILGFPEWFFYSCIVGYLGISFILWGAVRLVFKDIPLDGPDAGAEEKEDGKND